jgi:hypothetical protein
MAGLPVGTTRILGVTLPSQELHGCMQQRVCARGVLRKRVRKAR